MSIYCLLIVLLLSPLFAAQQSGSVRSGKLTIPGSTITATQGEKKVVTTTDDGGQYVFANLPAGAWTFQVEMFGFNAAQREITLDDKPGKIDWTLELKPLSGPAPVSTAKPAPAPAEPPRPTPSRARAASGGLAQHHGFRSLSLNDTAESPAMAANDGQPRADAGGLDGGPGPTESLLVNGSLSTGLDAPGQQGSFDYYRREEFFRGLRGRCGGGTRGPVGDL